GNGATGGAARMSANQINADAANADLDGINAAILDLLTRAQGIHADAAAALTEEAQAAGMIVCAQPGVAPTIEEGTGRVLDPGKPEGRREPVTSEQWAVLKGRVALLGSL